MPKCRLDHPVVCDICKQTFTGHKNSKYCKECKSKFKYNAISSILKTDALTIAEIAKYALQKKSRKETAQIMGMNEVKLNRIACHYKIRFTSLKYDKQIIEAVAKFYSENGKVKTIEKFPDIKIRSIIERYNKFKPRQIRWQDNEIVESAKMAGIISMSSQYKYFNRPNAFSGSIKALHSKVFKCSTGFTNGLPFVPYNKLFVTGTPYTFVKANTATNSFQSRSIVLWLDAVNYIKPNVPNHIKELIQTMAKFQSWLHNTNDPNKIRKMINIREKL